ncbi:MAG TPA: alkaline phosphatase PhoX [Gammaproteobacteria bacterium]
MRRALDRHRRRLLAGLGGAALLAGPGLLRARPPRAGLGPPDALGLRLPPAFSARVVARSGVEPVPGCGYPWHAAPDGGGCFAGADGGWIYVSNCELKAPAGGVGALRFDASGAPVDAYPLLRGSARNCAGAVTPWGTWLSCEEVPDGRVWECDPHGREAARPRDALGRFAHEGAAVDPATATVYLTEDVSDGALYRFRPAARDAGGRADLERGVLEVALAVPGQAALAWRALPDPAGTTAPTRHQLPGTARFAGGEGVAWLDGTLYFSTKGDDRVWAYRPDSGRLRVLYDGRAEPRGELRGVDNLAVTPWGGLAVAEDGDDMQLVALELDGTTWPLLQLLGHARSELAGPAFSPDGRRLYLSAQRGADGDPRHGFTVEVSGPFAGGPVRG